MKKSIVMTLLVMFGLSACSKKVEPPVKEDDLPQTQPEIEAEDEHADVRAINVGDRFVVSNKDGSDAYAITVTSVGLTDYRYVYNETAEQPKRLLALEYTYENIGFVDGDESLLITVRFYASSDEGEVLDTYANVPGDSGIDIPDLVDHGGSSSTVIFFALEDGDTSKSVTVTYGSETESIFADPVFKILVNVD